MQLQPEGERTLFARLFWFILAMAGLLGVLLGSQARAAGPPAAEGGHLGRLQAARHPAGVPIEEGAAAARLEQVFCRTGHRRIAAAGAFPVHETVWAAGSRRLSPAEDTVIGSPRPTGTRPAWRRRSALPESSAIWGFAGLSGPRPV